MVETIKNFEISTLSYPYRSMKCPGEVSNIKLSISVPQQLSMWYLWSYPEALQCWKWLQSYALDTAV